ncbi:MAG: GNAT family N-acetyltransferase [Ramlibacter sp.]|nr:GNAT family N-acetyltransferase [Ramlibacter sp.]
MPVTAAEQKLTIRALTRDDLPAVVAIDAAIEGRWRRNYIERRLASALREPALHAQFAACDAKGLAGYILARVLEGEFGRAEPALRLEMVGVRPDARGHGSGARLFQALSEWALRRGIRDVRTSVGWQGAGMMGWLAAMGFKLAPSYILDLGLDEIAPAPLGDNALTIPAGHGPGGEIDFGAPQANDNERLALERPEVRPMKSEDLQEIVRIDHAITGRDRGSYIGSRLAEAMELSAIRVSLAARFDGAVIGFVMARADLGDFGRTEPVAVVDTIGIDPEYAHRGFGQALLRQLFANLSALQVERVETVVKASDLALLGFFQSMGFAPSQRLAFVHQLGAA